MSKNLENESMLTEWEIEGLIKEKLEELTAKERARDKGIVKDIDLLDYEQKMARFFNKFSSMQKSVALFHLLDNASRKDAPDILVDIPVEDITDAENLASAVKCYETWTPHIIPTEGNACELIFTYIPRKDYEDIGNILKRACKAYQKNKFDACVNGTLEYLRRASSPQTQAYGLLALAYTKNRQQTIKNANDKGAKFDINDRAKLKKKRMLTESAFRLYNFLLRKDMVVRSETLEQDVLSSEEELLGWMNGIREAKKPNNQPAKIKNLDTSYIRAINDCIKATKEKEKKNLTIEEAGIRLEYGFELIDTIKLNYARMAIRANIPSKATSYISAVETTKGLTATTKAYLEDVKRELRLFALDSDPKVPKEDQIPEDILSLIESVNGQPSELRFAEPGKRKYK